MEYVTRDCPLLTAESSLSEGNDLSGVDVRDAVTRPGSVLIHLAAI